MKYHLTQLFIILSIFTFFTTENVYWEFSISKIESYITPDSSSDSIKKLETLFSELEIYTWSIDWNYQSIKDTLINYQIKSWIIENKDSYWAWYFWEKTISTLRKDYDKFEEKASLILKKDEILQPVIWPRTFVVTAYYSPLPWQKKYLKWSYEADIKLNWKWVHWASWKPVASWMLAWPKNYAFWTKVYIEWLWVWSIEDRGSAIVMNWERWYDYDRIDVWMWYWDDWLKKALSWWKRTVKWEILENTAEITMKYNEDKWVALSKEKKNSLQEIKNRILTYIDNKYNSDDNWKEKYKLKLKKTIDTYIMSMENPVKKAQLIYLREIL